MRAIGILGGTFDPIHFGHLRMAQELFEMLGLAEVRFVPAANPAHRDTPQTSAQHRAEMVALAISGNPAFTLDTRELHRAGASYTFDTLSELRTELGPEAPIVLLLGGDAFLGLPTWHRWQELADLAHIVVAHRPGTIPNAALLPEKLKDVWQRRAISNPAELHASPAGRMLMQDIPALDISASSIRGILHQGRSPRYLLPESVHSYIHSHQLYLHPPAKREKRIDSYT